MSNVVKLLEVLESMGTTPEVEASLARSARGLSEEEAAGELHEITEIFEGMANIVERVDRRASGEEPSPLEVQVGLLTRVVAEGLERVSERLGQLELMLSTTRSSSDDQVHQVTRPRPRAETVDVPADDVDLRGSER